MNKKNNIIQINENPFSKLDNAEIEMDLGFIELFSPCAVNSCMELYKRGNVIIAGTEGSGKSMLLNLLKPEIRISYIKNGKIFPVSEMFLGAGINFTRSGLLDIGARIVSRLEFGENRKFDAPKFFGDFINYWVVRDVINSINKYKKELNPDTLKENLNMDCSDEKECIFVKILTKSPAWSGYLENVKSVKDLLDKLDKRINKYRRISTDNYPEPIPEEICKTLTEIGEPISQAAEALYNSGILLPETSVLIRFDQYEDLFDAVDFDGEIAEKYRHVVNKFLWTRDPNVSFKIGTRPYALIEKLNVFGLGKQELEPERHYHYIDLEKKLSRKEDRSSWLFPKLANDVFMRRLKTAGYPNICILNFFGSTMSPYMKAQIVVSKNSRKKALGNIENIKEPYKTFLIDLAVGLEPANKYSHIKESDDTGDLLSAKLGVAWVLQKEMDVSSHALIKNIEFNNNLPWDEAEWWKKERINLALLQISSSSGQRQIWSGKEDILTLSGSNILIFLNICREIWGVWEQAQRIKEEILINFDDKPIVDAKYQSTGIYITSSFWYNKVVSRTKGDSRKRLIDKIGKELFIKLRNDKKMSYPGHNGFSLSISDYEKPEIKNTLVKAVRFGDLIELHHTPKNKNQGRRKKWYLMPILSPELGLPASHTKEPYYMNYNDIYEWISDAQKIDESILKE